MSDLIYWSNDYCLGHEIIDAEHEKLFEMANQIFHIKDPTGDVDTIKLLLHELYDYMQTHFRHEEEYMKEISFPKRKDHIEKHEAIIQEMNQALKTSRNMEQPKTKLNDLMVKWVLTHIIEEDRKIAPQDS